MSHDLATAVDPGAGRPRSDGSSDRPIFSASEIIRRQREIVRRLEAECVVIPSFHSSYYASGFPMRQFGRWSVTILFKEHPPALIVPVFELSGARRQSPIADIRTYDDSRPPIPSVVRVVAEILGERRVSVVGIEGEGANYAMTVALASALPRLELRDETAAIDAVRLVSSPEEVGLLRMASEIADAGMTAMLSSLRFGVAETDVAAAGMRRMEDLSEEGFDVQGFCYMQQNERTAECHASAHQVPIGRKGFVELLAECEVWHYQASIERPVLLGVPDERLDRIYDTSLEAARAARAAVKPGATFAQVDAASRDVLIAGGLTNVMSGAGLVRNVLHHTGGRMAAGDLRPYNEQTLRPGMTLTIEPWSLVDGVGGVRFCDPLVVTETGHERLADTHDGRLRLTTTAVERE